MIITEKINEKYSRTYSNSNYKIRQLETGHIYNSAIDKNPIAYTYEETILKRTDLSDINNFVNYEQIIDILTGQEGEE